MYVYICIFQLKSWARCFLETLLWPVATCNWSSWRPPHTVDVLVDKSHEMMQCNPCKLLPWELLYMCNYGMCMCITRIIHCLKVVNDDIPYLYFFPCTGFPLHEVVKLQQQQQQPTHGREQCAGLWFISSTFLYDSLLMILAMVAVVWLLSYHHAYAPFTGFHLENVARGASLSPYWIPVIMLYSGKFLRVAVFADVGCWSFLCFKFWGSALKQGYTFQRSQTLVCGK